MLLARGKLYQEIMKRLDEARTLDDSGIQFSGEKTTEQITAVKTATTAQKGASRR